MSDKLPTFEELTAPSVNGLFASPDSRETEKPFLDGLFTPPQPETHGRITLVAAPVKRPEGKYRVIADPAVKWLRELMDMTLWKCIHTEMNSCSSRAEKLHVLHKAYTKYLLEQEHTALSEQMAAVQSWRG